MKHVGMVKNTGKKCVVVFREIYNEEGKVVQPDKCLVVELENLPDFAYHDVVSIVESEPAQRTGDLYDVFSRTRLSDGNVVLTWLHSTGRLRKYDTANIDMIVSNSSKLNLATLNKIIGLQKQGYSEKEIESILANDTDSAPRKMNNLSESVVNQEEKPVQPVNEGILSDEDLAKSYLAQSKTMATEADRLKKQAYELDPSLKRTRKSSKETVNEENN